MEKETKVIYNLAIDADSIVYKAAYRNQILTKIDEGTNKERTVVSIDLEMAYFNFISRITRINDAVYKLHERQKGDDVNFLIVMSPRKSFRNEMSPSGVTFDDDGKDMGYKANRKPSDIVGISDLKRLILSRLENVVYTKNLIGDPKGKPEADDVVNYFARVHSYMVAAIDKDVINANPTHTYNYNKYEWVIPHAEHEIERWYLKQALMGDSTDNVHGGKKLTPEQCERFSVRASSGIGKVTAEKIVNHEDVESFSDITEFFKDDYDALLNFWLVRMDMYDGDKINLVKY